MLKSTLEFPGGVGQWPVCHTRGPPAAPPKATAAVEDPWCCSHLLACPNHPLLRCRATELLQAPMTCRAQNVVPGQRLPRPRPLSKTPGAAVNLTHPPAHSHSPAATASHCTAAPQVWYPDSASKTAAAIEEFGLEQLPLFILANWRGFSGGQRDLFDGVLQVRGRWLRTHTPPWCGWVAAARCLAACCRCSDAGCAHTPLVRIGCCSLAACCRRGYAGYIHPPLGAISRCMWCSASNCGASPPPYLFAAGEGPASRPPR